jgi:hypothetical protein
VWEGEGEGGEVVRRRSEVEEQMEGNGGMSTILHLGSISAASSPRFHVNPKGMDKEEGKKGDTVRRGRPPSNSKGQT